MSWTRTRQLLRLQNNISLVSWQCGLHRHLSSVSGYQSSTAYCSELVRKHDYEGYLCSLLLHNDLRRAAFAIRAFNTELAMIRDMVSTPALGQMRLQFWRDSLDQVYKGQPLQQPVAQELAWVLKRRKLSRLWMKKLIDCREQTLSDHPHQSLKSLEDYVHDSVSSVYYLILEASGVQSVNVDHLADHAGKVQGLSYFLRGIPFNAARGRVAVPTQLLAKHKVTQEDFLRGKRDDTLREVVFKIASSAHGHLEMVTSLQSELNKDVKNTFLPVVPCSIFLSRLQKKNFDVFDSSLHRRDNLLPFRLWWTVKFKRKLL